MRKIFLIGNTIYLPIESGIIDTTDSTSQKYMKGGIGGDLYPQLIFTEEEIKKRTGNSALELYEVKNLHELITKWGPR